jgi:hypothetical protein
VFALDTPPQHLDPPPKSQWLYQTDFDGIGFRCSGKGKIGNLLNALVMAVFWNGIVLWFELGLFGVIPPIKHPVEGIAWWIVFSFLIPFILMGLVLIGFVLLSFLDLFRRTSWTFTRGRAEFRTVLFGWAWTEYHELTGWTSLVVGLPKDEEIKPELIAKGNNAIREHYDNGNRWQLVFRNSAEEELLAIENLSKPEALWMADVLLWEQRVIR